MAAYYNEIDPFAAAWLRELIKAGHVAPGDVDERSIEDVHPDDIRSYTQCHFFAGIGVWSHALRRAGWSDDRPVWTGSCPCQPFSAAGKGGGFTDERHLWPSLHHLVRVLRPPVLLGEQVASKDGLAWLDLVRADVEGAGRSFGSADVCAAGLGAPHIRQRTWFVSLAMANDEGHGCGQGRADGRGVGSGDRPQGGTAGPLSGGAAGGVVDTKLPKDKRQRQHSGTSLHEQTTTRPARGRVDDGLVSDGADTWMFRGMADADGGDTRPEREQRGGEQRQQPQDGGCGAGATFDPTRHPNDGQGGSAPDAGAGGSAGVAGRPGPVNGHWAAADWLLCRDGRWRPVEPGTLPLAHGAPNRVGRLRGYGNAIVAPVAQAFVEIVMEIIAADDAR